MVRPKNRMTRIWMMSGSDMKYSYKGIDLTRRGARCNDCGDSLGVETLKYTEKVCEECWNWRKKFAAAFNRLTPEQYRRGAAPGVGRRERIKEVLKEIESLKVN